MKTECGLLQENLKLLEIKYLEAEKVEKSGSNDDSSLQEQLEQISRKLEETEAALMSAERAKEAEYAASRENAERAALDAERVATASAAERADLQAQLREQATHMETLEQELQGVRRAMLNREQSDESEEDRAAEVEVLKARLKGASRELLDREAEMDACKTALEDRIGELELIGVRQREAWEREKCELFRKTEREQSKQTDEKQIWREESRREKEKALELLKAEHLEQLKRLKSETEAGLRKKNEEQLDETARIEREWSERLADAEGKAEREVGQKQAIIGIPP